MDPPEEVLLDYGDPLPRFWYPWQEAFLWKPKVINGKLMWLKKVYFRYSSFGSKQYASDIFEMMTLTGKEE